MTKLEQHEAGKNFIGIVPNYPFKKRSGKLYIKAQHKHLKSLEKDMYDDALDILEQAWDKYHANTPKRRTI